jgi:hypothetical protein
MVPRSKPTIVPTIVSLGRLSEDRSDTQDTRRYPQSIRFPHGRSCRKATSCGQVPLLRTQLRVTETCASERYVGSEDYSAVRTSLTQVSEPNIHVNVRTPTMLFYRHDSRAAVPPPGPTSRDNSCLERSVVKSVEHQGCSCLQPRSPQIILPSKERVERVSSQRQALIMNTDLRTFGRLMPLEALPHAADT